MIHSEDTSACGNGWKKLDMLDLLDRDLSIWQTSQQKISLCLRRWRTTFGLDTIVYYIHSNTDFVAIQHHILKDTILLHRPS